MRLILSRQCFEANENCGKYAQLSLIDSDTMQNNLTGPKKASIY